MNKLPGILRGWGRQVVGTPSPVIILNGPPGSGKDTLSRFINAAYGLPEHRFKTELLRLAIAISGVEPSEWHKRYNDRRLKEEPWVRLGNLSQRQFLIRISEEWVKPTFGNHYFGIALAQSLTRRGAVVSDGGFPEELHALKSGNLLGLCYEGKIHVVRLHWRGKDFAGDSRNYLYPDSVITDIDPVVRFHDYDITVGEPAFDAHRIAKMTGLAR